MLPLSNVAHPRLYYLVSEDCYLLSRRLPMAYAVYDIADAPAAARLAGAGAVVAAKNFTVHPQISPRGSTNPGDTLPRPLPLPAGWA